MINGIDLLFAVIGLILLLIFVTGWDRYKDWSEWDQNRRRMRKREREELQESFIESQYRKQLRVLLADNFISAIHKATRTFAKLNEVLGGNRTY